MLYLTKDSGTAIGEVIAAISSCYDVSDVEVKLSQDTLTALLHVKRGKRKTAVHASSLASAGSKILSKTVNKRKAKRGRKSAPILYEFDGESLDALSWAKKLGVSENCVRYRISKFGSPYGKGPSDSDKIIAGM